MPKLTLTIIAVLFTTGCSISDLFPLAFTSQTTVSYVVGDPERGAELFQIGANDAAPPCATCHQVVSGGFGFTLGPNLEGIQTRAATRIAGMSAEQYIEDSILHPDHHVVPGFRVSMYANYADHLSAQAVADLVAYLMTL